MARPRTDVGTFGQFTYITAHNGKVKARVRFRDDDGQLRLVQATGDTRTAAERALKKKLTRRDNFSAGSRDLAADSTFGRLVEVWLADLDLTGRLAVSTRGLYERNMRQLVMPAFEHLLLREITVRKVDQFIKTLAANKSYSMAKQACTVLSLALGLAVRYDALRENPVRSIAVLHKPPSQAMALTSAQVDAIRVAVRGWRRGTGLSGPKPDGQLEQIIEVMLGTSGRIGEVLAIRKCDVDVTVTPARVRICGTIISPTGKPTYRQPHPKTEKSTRVVSVPSFTAEVIRQRLVALAEEPEEPVVLQPQPHVLDDEQRAPSPPDHPGGSRHRRRHAPCVPAHRGHRASGQRRRPRGRHAGPYVLEDHQAALHRARRDGEPSDGRDSGSSRTSWRRGDRRRG